MLKVMNRNVLALSMNWSKFPAFIGMEFQPEVV